MVGIFKWRSTNKLVATLAEDLQALLRTNKELIFNERDLQVRVATWLRDSRHYDEVDMEYAVPKEELSARGVKIGSNSFPWNNDLSIDVVVEKDGAFAAIELKYATRPVDVNITRLGEPLKTDCLIVKDQAASDLIMYNYWKDVRRVELLTRCYPAVKGGVALLITNNVTYWREPQPASGYRAFSTYEGNTLRPGLLEWDKNTAASVLRKHPDFELGGTFEKKMEEVFGIYVQVATPDDSKLAKNDITLAAAGRE